MKPITKAILSLIISMILAVLAGASYDDKAAAANTEWLILTARYFGSILGSFGAFGFGVVSLGNFGKAVGLAD